MQCAMRIKEAFETLDMLLDEGKYEQVSHDFMSCYVVKEPRDVAVMVDNLAFIFMIVVQADNYIPGENITYVCQEMSKAGDPYNNLKTLYQVGQH